MILVRSPPSQLSDFSHTTIPTGKDPTRPYEVTEPSPLLLLPREVRDEVLRYALPISQTINLTRLPKFIDRATWTSKDGEARVDPPILSVNHQIHSEACDILYNREFALDLNCGTSDFAEQFDLAWRYSPLLSTGFPIHNLTTVALNLGIYDQDHPNHLFDHVLSTIGTLATRAPKLEELTLHLTAGYEYHEWVNPKCPGYNLFPSSVLAEMAGVEECWDDAGTIKNAEFFLRPLVLLQGHGVTCKIIPPERLETNEEMKKIVAFYGRCSPFKCQKAAWEPTLLLSRYNGNSSSPNPNGSLKVAWEPRLLLRRYYRIRDWELKWTKSSTLS
ncbi:MAG: hypothetical protein Q9174_004917 [Haloplaca sp. 1 TL-2023]